MDTEYGCDDCKLAALGGTPQDGSCLSQVGEAHAGWTPIYRCSSCGTYWYETQRFIAPLTVAELENMNPKMF